MAGRSVDPGGAEGVLVKREFGAEPVQGRVGPVVSADPQPGGGVLRGVLPGVQKEGLHHPHQLPRPHQVVHTVAQSTPESTAPADKEIQHRLIDPQGNKHSGRLTTANYHSVPTHSTRTVHTE